MDCKDLANLIFPDVKDYTYYEEKYNKRSTDIKSNLFDFISVFLLLYSAFSTTMIS